MNRTRTGGIHDAPTDAVDLLQERARADGPRMPTLGEIVRAFKAASARAIRRDCDPTFGWHRNYYERVIRNERELSNVYEYIVTNPAKWATDELYPTGGSGSSIAP
jgi:putative transposase